MKTPNSLRSRRKVGSYVVKIVEKSGKKYIALESPSKSSNTQRHSSPIKEIIIAAAIEENLRKYGLSTNKNEETPSA